MSYAKYLTIRSIDRIPGSTSTNFQIQLKDGIPSVKSVELLAFLCPNTLYKIRPNVNNYFVWSRGGTNYYYIIPGGSYSISSLITLIQTNMNTQDNNSYNITYSSDLMTITISGTNAFILNFGSSAYSNMLCYRELGFIKADILSATSITSPNCISLERPTSLYITIREFMQSGVDTNIQSYSFYVPINVPSGYMIDYKRTHEPQIIEFS